MIVWTLIAVILTGVGVFASVLQPPSTIKRNQAQINQAHETKIEISQQKADDRAPASAQFSSTAVDEKGSQALDFTLPCEGNGRFSKNVIQVRLTGTICGKKKAVIESSEIRNMTNGFSATVFPSAKQDTFTTDYITLAQGENHIRILHFLKSGEKVERDFGIQR